MFAKALKKSASEFAYRRRLIKYAGKLPALSTTERSIVETLKQEGVVVTSLDALAIPSTPLMLDATNHLRQHLPETSTGDSSDVWDVRHHSVFTTSAQLISETPDIFLWGLEERLLGIVENYIGLPVAYLGASLRKEIPNGKQIGTRLWHRDMEDRRMIKIIIYLNDVKDEGGPFEYIPKPLTPSYRTLRRIGKPYVDEKMKQVVPMSSWKSCTGSAGTVIFADPANIFHHAKVPLSERTALFFTYTSRQPKRLEVYRPDRSKLYRESLIRLAARLPKRQSDCVFIA